MAVTFLALSAKDVMRSTSRNARQRWREPMQAFSKIIAFKQQPKQVLKSENPFLVPDRAARCAMQKTAERIDVARRYWACPF
jgi:hypothetical protein